MTTMAPAARVSCPQNKAVVTMRGNTGNDCYTPDSATLHPGYAGCGSASHARPSPRTTRWQNKR